MSAFVHSPAHIISIVASAAHLKLGTLSFRRAVYDLANPADCQRLCDLLHLANVRSVNRRYDERGRRQRLSYLPSDGSPDCLSVALLTPSPLCKAIDSLDYQSDQRPDWDKSTACAILTQLRARAEALALDRASLPDRRAAAGQAAKLPAYQTANVWAIN